MIYKKTADQKRWQGDLFQMGCVITGSPACEIQHIKGASFKHNKVWIGQYATIPLCYEYHRDLENDFNVTTNKEAFEGRFGSQWDLMLHILERAEDQGIKLPPADVVSAILDLAPGGLINTMMVR